MTEPDFWTALTQWWKELATLSAAIAGLFGLRKRARGGNTLPTRIEMELALSKHEQIITGKINELKDHVDNKIEYVYKTMHHLDEKTNSRVDSLK